MVSWGLTGTYWLLRIISPNHPLLFPLVYYSYYIYRHYCHFSNELSGGADPRTVSQKWDEPLPQFSVMGLRTFFASNSVVTPG